MLAGFPIAGAPIAGRTTESATPTTPPITRPLVLLLDRDGRTTIVDSEGRPMTDFWIKKGDTSPVITGQLLDGDLRPVNITGATVRFRAKDRTTGASVIDAAATVTDATTGQVRYAWQAADTAAQREMLAEWVVTFADSTIQSWPNPGLIALHVDGDAT